jgi:KDO2-lipid IV(A) lauroyltransferase
MTQIFSKFSIYLLNSLSAISWKNAFILSDVINYLLFDVIGYRKKVILKNLRNSFPDKSEAEIQAIAQAYHQHLTDLIVETIKFKTAPEAEILERMQGDINIMNRYFQQGKNLIYLMGHRGNWELANLFSSLCFQHECIVVYRPLQNAESEKWFLELRTRFNATMVPMNQVFRELQKKRTRPYVLVLANDQSPVPQTAFWTQFLNQDTGVFRGVEAIARRYNLTVLNADFKKTPNKRGYYQLDIKVITEDPCAMRNNEILERQLRILESDIVEQPENWLWSHRRWKHKRPNHIKSDQLLAPVSRPIEEGTAQFQNQI